MFPEQISTSRLTLRRPVEADSRGLFTAYAQDPLVCRFLLWRPHTSENTVREFVGICIAGWESGAKFPYVITEAPSSTAIGMIEARAKGFTVDLGYVLARSHWGKGYMPEAIAALVAALTNSVRV